MRGIMYGIGGECIMDSDMDDLIRYEIEGGAYDSEHITVHEYERSGDHWEENGIVHIVNISMWIADNEPDWI
jgi:hypothetical protein